MCDARTVDQHCDVIERCTGSKGSNRMLNKQQSQTSTLHTHDTQPDCSTQLQQSHAVSGRQGTAMVPVRTRPIRADTTSAASKWTLACPRDGDGWCGCRTASSPIGAAPLLGCPPDEGPATSSDVTQARQITASQWQQRGVVAGAGTYVRVLAQVKQLLVEATNALLVAAVPCQIG